MIRTKNRACIAAMNAVLVLSCLVFLFPIAWIDDLILWIWILWHLRETLDKYWMGEKNTNYSKKYKNKTIIDDAEYEVKEEK